MQNDIKVSVIMTVYNHERYLRQALDSILSQNVSFKIEVLIGEDNSPDQSGEILREYEASYPGFFTVVYRTKNIGATRNVYDLLKRGRGKYIAYLEGDDYWVDDEKLQKEADFLEQFSEYEGVAGDFIRVDMEGNQLEASCIDEAFRGSKFTWEDFLKYGFVFQTGTLMHRNYFKEGVDFSIFYKAHDLVSDLTNNTLILNRGDIFILPEVLSAYRYVITQDATNACSVSKRNESLAQRKLIRQCALLNPYVKKKKNYNEKIGALKTDYFIRCFKRDRGYRFSDLISVMRTGGFRANLWCFKALSDLFIYKLRKKGKKNG